MKNLLWLIILLYSFSAGAFPKILDWKDKPMVIYENKKQAELKRQGQLKLAFAVVTGEEDRFEFQINNVDTVLVYPKTKIQIMEVAVETGFVPELFLLDGQMRFSTGYRGLARNGKAPDVLTIKTPFFDLKTQSEADFVIYLDMKEPSVEVKVLRGVLPLEFFSYEKKVRLKEGESVKFTGVLSEDRSGIKYDYLLHGRKAPQGEIGVVQPFEQSAFFQSEKKHEEDVKKRDEERRKKEAEKRRKQKEYEASFLCKNPFGHRDQCSWRIEDGKCYRRRCNASGTWGDKTERPLTAACGKEFTVAPCDF